jgi:hypothetical protein
MGQLIVWLGIAAFVAYGFGKGDAHWTAKVAMLAAVGYLIGCVYHVFPWPAPLITVSR